MNKKLLLRISAIISGLSGVVILIGVFYPIISYKSPNTSEVAGISSKEEVDYLKASNWFPSGVPKDAFTSPKVSFYTISIPKLSIENATVTIGGEDLSKSLVQYPGTVVPGKRGNTVIFGHSILPIFYDPKRYIAIFSILPTLKKGDEIDVNYDTISYKYRVEEMFEVLPTNLEVLKQGQNDSYLTLITCVPPGDPRKPKRLIVRARIISSTQAYENTRN